MSHDLPHDPFQAYVDPARARAELWRTAAGSALTVVAGFALYQFSFAVAATLLGPATTQSLIDATSLDPATPAATLYTLLTFGFFAVGLGMVVRSLHQRSPLSLIGPVPAALRDFLRVFAAVGALLGLLALLLPRDGALVANPHLDHGSWLMLLPLSLFAVWVQAATEELVFRGYLQQQLAARFPAAPIWMLGPATLFGFAHFDPATAGANAPWFVAWAVAFGLAAADLTARTGTIGAAVGLHAANNAAAILLVTLPGPGAGLALWQLPVAPDAPQLPALLLPEFAALLCCWLAARVALRL